MTSSERRFATLDEWLAWQETFHHSEIDLGLERVSRVARELIELPPPYPVITVAGTNGKGSVLACLEAVTRAAGYRTGLFTSPHLVRYNERVAVAGVLASDERLMDAFAEVDAARGSTSLTYFEFSALAALLIFQRSEIEVGLLEIGMGGRLDAVNIIAPDVAIITNIGLDHQAWLGDDREAIGREKAGIMRGGRPVVCGDPDPPRSLLEHAAETGAQLLRVERDYDFSETQSGWDFRGPAERFDNLPLPALAGDVQVANAALALTALQCLGDRLPLTVDHIRSGLAATTLAGRIQRRGSSPEWVMDVCHNPDSARVLADWLAAHPCSGRTRLILGMLADKDVESVARILAPVADDWYLASLGGSRGLSAAELARRMTVAAQPRLMHFSSVAEACTAATADAAPADRIVVCGSFHTVGEALALEL